MDILCVEKYRLEKLEKHIRIESAPETWRLSFFAKITHALVKGW
jgi:hypothetical protein